MEKVGKIWKFWFSLSLFCENAVGSKHKLKDQRMHFHSLVHSLAGLNENLHLSVEFSRTFAYHLIWAQDLLTLDTLVRYPPIVPMPDSLLQIHKAPTK